MSDSREYLIVIWFMGLIVLLYVLYKVREKYRREKEPEI
jgi:hypothetical protein